MLLDVIYWVILVLAVIGIFYDEPANPRARYASRISWIVLFIAIGLRAFKMSLS